MSIDIARATARQNSIAPYLNHLRLSRLDTDQRQMKGSDEWIDNVRTWVQVIAYLAGKNRQFKPAKITETEEEFSDLLLVETAAALSTGAHFPKMRSRILEHSKDWETFIGYVDSQLEGDVSKLTNAK